MISVLILAGCSTTSALSVNAEQQRDVTRKIVGTSLVGCGSSDCVNSAVAGLCGAKVYTPSECRKHTETQKK